MDRLKTGLYCWVVNLNGVNLIQFGQYLCPPFEGFNSVEARPYRCLRIRILRVASTVYVWRHGAFIGSVQRIGAEKIAYVVYVDSRIVGLRAFWWKIVVLQIAKGRCKTGIANSQ